MHAPTLCASLTACPQPCSHALTHAPAAEPTEDAEAEAAAAVSALTDCDVVLTSYAVLQQEVHYSPSSGTLSSLRHAKRYKVRVDGGCSSKEVHYYSPRSGTLSSLRHAKRYKVRVWEPRGLGA